MPRTTRTRPHGRRAACLAALALALLPAAADARLGDLDPSFDGDGVARPALGFPASLRSVAVQPDGAILAGGTIVDTQPASVVIRLTPSGALDAGFGNGGIVLPPANVEDGAIAALAVESGGSILAAGATAAGSLETNPQARLARISADGSTATDIPLPVASVTPVTASFVTSLALLPDGKIVLGGWAMNAGLEQFMAMRLQSNGAPDTSFSGDGVAFASFGAGVPARAAAVAVDAAERVSLAGQVAPAGTTEGAAARLTATGLPDATFSGDGLVRLAYPLPFSGASRLLGAVQRGTTLLATGSIATGSQGVVQGLVDGAPDPAFGVGGLPGASAWQAGPLNAGEAVALTSTGGAVVAGRTGNGNAAQLQTAWFAPAGASDPGGGGVRNLPIALAIAGPGVGLATAPGDATVVAGTGNAQDPFVARFLPNAAPVAALAAEAGAVVGTAALFDASGSSDPEGEALRYAFDFDGDGAFELDGGTNPLAVHSFPSAGVRNVGVRVTDPRGAGAVATRSVSVVVPDGAVPRPVLSKQGVARPIRGKIRIRLPGKRRFVPLKGLTAIPNGTEIDARKGRVLLTVLHDASGRLDAARFYAGRFIFRQGKGRTPITTLRLTGGSFAGCGAGQSRARSVLAATATAHAAAQKRKKKKVRSLWGDGRGRFRTRGRYGAATVRGTKWLTRDRCDGTLVRVVRGKVAVDDLVRPRRKVKLITGGNQILIAAKGRG